MINLTQLAEIFEECRFRKGDSDRNIVLVDGLIKPANFSYARLKKWQGKIEVMLSQLPDSFHNAGGSLAEAYKAIHGRTPSKPEDLGNSVALNQLITLGQAIGKVKNLHSKTYEWVSLPEDTPVFLVRP